MSVGAAPRSFTIYRRFAAPPELVFRAWTEPKLLGWFFNPDLPREGEPTVDLRVGGAWRQMMAERPGKSYVTGGIYREIVPNRRLVFAWGAVGGWPPLDPDRLENAATATVTLERDGAGTLMQFTLAFPAHLSERELKAQLDLGMEPGWRTTLDRLVLRPS